MKQISLDNGRHFLTAQEAIEEMYKTQTNFGISIEKQWQTVENMMDSETAQTVERELGLCRMVDFLERYLEIAPMDLIIG